MLEGAWASQDSLTCSGLRDGAVRVHVLTATFTSAAIFLSTCKMREGDEKDRATDSATDIGAPGGFRHEKFEQINAAETHECDSGARAQSQTSDDSCEG